MATIPPRQEFAEARGAHGIETVLVTWSDLSVGDVGGAVKMPDWMVASVQAVGSFTAAVAEFEGSNDGENFGTLDDSGGVPLRLNNAHPRRPVEHTQFFRPRIVASRGDIAPGDVITVIALFRRGAQ